MNANQTANPGHRDEARLSSTHSSLARHMEAPAAPRARNPSRRILWIHIGTHKTGTSSIQVAAARERDLLRRHGLYVPKVGMTTEHSGHHNIAWDLRGDPRFRPVRGGLAELVAELTASGERRALISSEDLEYLVAYPERIAKLEGFLHSEGWEPAYIVYFRPQADYTASLFEELGKHGLTIDFARFATEILVRGQIVTKEDWLFSFDYVRFLERWRAATTGMIQTRVYERGRPTAHLIRDFLLLLGVDADAATLVAERSPKLNVGAPRRPGLGERLAAVLLEARFARSNACLRRSWGVKLSSR